MAGLGNYIGSALLGMGQGIQQGQQQQQDQAFQQAQRPLLLQAMALKNQSSLLTIQQQQAQLSEDQWLAQDNQSQGINQNDPNAGTQPAPSKPDPANQGATGAAPVLTQPAGPSGGGFAKFSSPAMQAGNAGSPTVPPVDRADRLVALKQDLSDATRQMTATTDPAAKADLQKTAQILAKQVAALQSPTEKIEAMPVATAQSNIADNKEAAGIPLQPSDHAAVSDSLNQQASRLNAQADRAAAAGHIRLANTLREKAAGFGEKADLAKQREIAVGKTQTADVKEAMSNVDPATMTQEEYNSLRATLGQNPEFVRRVSAKGLTGDIDQDRDQIAKWQHESLGVVKSTELEYKQKDYDLRVQQAKREDERLKMAKNKEQTEKDQTANNIDDQIGMAYEGQSRTQIVQSRGGKGDSEWDAITKGAVDRIQKENPGMSRQDAQHVLSAKQQGYKGNTAAVVQTTKDIAAITPFKQMLDKNVDIAVDLGKKLDFTSSKWANKTLNDIKQSGSDNPDLSEYLAQMRFVQTEAARVLNNPRLVGQLSDSARNEMDEVVSGNMPLASTERVLRRIQSDGNNRVEAMQKERTALLAGDKTDSGGAVTPKGDSPKLPAGTPPPPKGFNPI